jgi:hypothetical protein
MEASPTASAAHGSSRRRLLVLGLLWLALAVVILMSHMLFPPAITIEWVTETEVNTVGFNIYRSQSLEGDFQKLNETLLPSEGSPVSGSSYAFVDKDVVPGQTYYYQLQDVELDNTIETHETIQYTAPGIAGWVYAAAGISGVFGLILLFRGLR